MLLLGQGICPLRSAAVVFNFAMVALICVICEELRVYFMIDSSVPVHIYTQRYTVNLLLFYVATYVAVGFMNIRKLRTRVNINLNFFVSF